jgi:hypothetical protein
MVVGGSPPARVGRCQAKEKAAHVRVAFFVMENKKTYDKALFDRTQNGLFLDF